MYGRILVPSLALGTAALMSLSADVALGSSPPVAVTAIHATDTGERKAGADDPWIQRSRGQIEREEYRASQSHRGLQAPNRANGVRTYFHDGSIEVVPRTVDSEPAWRFTWRTVRLGREGRADGLPGSAEPVAEANRVRYGRPGLTEWYENRSEGLEQGFTIASRPSGEGPLRLVGKIGGTLGARQTDPSAVELLDARGAPVMRYADLHVWDATRTELRSRLSLEGDELAIVIQDGRAAYPITVDPLMTSPSWTVDGDQEGAELGFSVAGAGDVNGDGYSDVIIGAPRYDNGETDEGRAFVYHGSAAGLANVPAWTVESDQGGALFGHSVASAGDVNGDGHADVIVGAYAYDNGEDDEGRTFVYHGSAGGLATVPAWTAECDREGAHFGFSVASAGDVNGDGYSDVIIGAPTYDNGDADEGGAFVYEGSAGGLATSPAWVNECEDLDCRLGYSVASAGDVNRDGYSDVIVGAPGATFDGPQNEGCASVFYGSAKGLNQVIRWQALGGQEGAALGTSVASADVNGDGYSDVIVGSPGIDNGQIDEGEVNVYHGSFAGLPESPFPSSWRVESNQAGARFGHSVAAAGDVNGDGHLDVLVGYEASVNGAVVYHGSVTGLEVDPAWMAAGVGADCVAGAGDVNGDGYSDVIVGVPHFSDDQGRVLLYHGAASGLEAFPSESAQDSTAYARFGKSVMGAGDVNGDGYSDVIIGAHNFDGEQPGAGKAVLQYGSAGGFEPDFWFVEGDELAEQLGNTVAGAGDVNGDGYSDVVISTGDGSGALAGRGRVFVFHGSAGGLSNSHAWTTGGSQDWESFGWSVASAGDVNGDGYSDLIVGAPYHDGGQSDEGRAFVFHGSENGLEPGATWAVESDLDFGSLGTSVASAGDVNADGYSDVIVNVPGLNSVFVYHGGADGLATAPAWVGSGGSDVGYGGSVASAGDVNGDGYSDVIIGHVGLGPGGSAHVYHGSPAGLGSAPAWTATRNESSSDFGQSVASAGDVNGDGYSDVIVGAPLLSRRGAAYAYLGSFAGLGAVAAWSILCDQAPNPAHDFSFSTEFGRSVASIGDLNGDGFSDVVVGAFNYDTYEAPMILNHGKVFVFCGNEGLGLSRVPRQRRAEFPGPISLLGRSDSPTEFRLSVRGRAHASKVRMQYEVKPFGTPFDGAGLVTGPPTDAGGTELVETVTGLTAGTLYHWRLRLLTDSPSAPHTPWMSPAGNAPSEADFRTAPGDVGVDAGPGAAHFWIEPAAPNPFHVTTDLRYTLPASGHVKLAVYDVAGREVAVLVDGTQEPGRHSARWHSRNSPGGRIAAGVYMARLAFAGRVESRKIVRLP